jgi:gamma-glutamyltranspeptidase/glutathione hydrolase
MDPGSDPPMTHGMVVAAQPEAAEAGAQALLDGGNAVDAAIACAFVQTVVDPQMSGLAGFGSMQIYMPGQGVHEFIDFPGRAPAAATPEMWEHLAEAETEDGFGFVLAGRVNDLGYQAVTAPGSLRAFHEALTRHGRLAWKDVIAPAIAFAEDGFPVRFHMVDFWTRQDTGGLVPHIERLRLTATGRLLYFDADGDLLRPGDRLCNPDMAWTLRRIADDGIDVFYEGEIAEAIAADMATHGGLLTMDDLRDYRPDDNEPLWGSYRGHRISTSRPPGGGVMVLEMLNMLEGFDLASMGHNSPEYIRVVAEAMKRATVDKDAHVGDPKFVDVPLDRLLDKDYAATHTEAIRRDDIAHVPRFGADPEPEDTTHVSVVDGDGNAVTLTHSLGTPSGAITEGLGFMYNGCMGVFDPRPGRTGSIAPGKARFSSIAPTIVFTDDAPYLVLGAPGGTYIAMGILQVILNVIDFGMSIAEAVAAPRFCATSDVVDVVNRIPRYVTREVEAKGYAVRRSHRSYHFAGVHAILIDDGALSGAADPGRDGVALLV